MLSKDIVILGGARTPFGKFGGCLKDFTATQLAVIAGREALLRAEVKPEEIDHTIFGNALQTSLDAAHLARHVGLHCEIPVPVPAFVVNRLCGSGFQAIISGAQEILLEQADEVLVGGTESMSQAPHVIHGARWGIPFGHGRLEDSLWLALSDTYCHCTLAITAENLANKYGVTRAEADELALRSHVAAAAAYESGRLQEEIVPIEIATRNGPKIFDRDEQVHADVNLEELAALKPSFLPTGVVTAGNGSGLNDGAAALVLTTLESAQQRSIKPLGKLIGWAAKGVQPEVMGIGPASAIREVLQRCKLELGDMDLIEINEAFAAQYVAVEKELGLAREKTNVNGGAVAIGHPLGASGARLTLTLLHELRRRKGRYGLASTSIGGGQGIAVIVEAWQD